LVGVRSFPEHERIALQVRFSNHGGLTPAALEPDVRLCIEKIVFRRRTSVH
jgi:hypothetical protein